MVGGGGVWGRGGGGSLNSSLTHSPFNSSLINSARDHRIDERDEGIAIMHPPPSLTWSASDSPCYSAMSIQTLASCRCRQCHQRIPRVSCREGGSYTRYSAAPNDAPTHDAQTHNTHCNTHCNTFDALTHPTREWVGPDCDTLHNTATHRNTLQHMHSHNHRDCIMSH